MHGVRRHILELLKERSAATVAELAEWLGMAPVSVRHHLDILQGDNLIRVQRLERRGSVGRPQQVYALTDEAAGHFPNNFALLAANLVRQVKQVLPPDQVEAVFHSLAQELASEFSTELNGECCAELGGSAGAQEAEERVRRVAEFLNARGYLASYEPTCAGIELATDAEGSFLLHKHNCPYAGISGEHQELCQMDQTLVDTLFDQHCERIAHMGSQDRCCTYRVRIDTGTGNAASVGNTAREADAAESAAPVLFDGLRAPIRLVA